ncbi:hypothetical protein CCUS01_05889 [Colletotrichum cuscutae]|uniref:Uncharacterized protein n=1 Tax=Colletotrichum cuscutae TaxID=1209917 RepID=A0AAI9V9Q0_9PEZI|nr:hypothetical protein CCUS01_05889 [Colletotrichum cuscutae]
MRRAVADEPASSDRAAKDRGESVMLALSQIPSILRLEEEESRLDCSDQTKASRVVGGQPCDGPENVEIIDHDRDGATGEQNVFASGAADAGAGVVLLQQKTDWKGASCARWDGAASGAGVRVTGVSPVSPMCRPYLVPTAQEVTRSDGTRTVSERDAWDAGRAS